VEDQVVLDLVYEARDIDQRLGSQEKIDAWFETKTKGLNDWQKDELKKQWGTMQNVLSSKSRMERVVNDIVFDFSVKPRLSSERGNALLVASSIYEASKYFTLVQKTPSGFPYLLLGRIELETGDTGTRRYSARGKVAISATAQPPASGGASSPRLAITLDIAPGWHVNSSAPLDETLIATRVDLDPGSSGWRLEGLTYPEPRKVRLGFQSSPLSVYTGRVDVTAGLARSTEASSLNPLPIAIRLQACDDRVCLRPEDVVLRVPVAPILRSASAPF